MWKQNIKFDAAHFCGVYFFAICLNDQFRVKNAILN